MKLKRIISSILAICMVLSTMGLTAFASETDYVAKVGETGYADLQEAIKAAAPAGTVEIIDNVTVDEWIMFSQRLSIGSGQIITLDMNGLTIKGNGNTLTVNSVESASNGNRLFHEADNLNIENLTINYADGVVGGISLKSGVLKNVTINGGVGVLPGTGNITITGCVFNTSGSAIYSEEARDNLVVTGNTFNTAAGQYAIYLRGATTFTNNTVVNGKVNVVSGSPIVSGNDFGSERFKVYNTATATITNNEIDNLVFNDSSEVKSTFVENTLSEAAEETMVTVNASQVSVAKIGETGYSTLAKAAAAAQANDTVELIYNCSVSSGEEVTFNNVNLKAAEGVILTLDGILNINGGSLNGVKIQGAGTTNFYETVNFYGDNSVISAINGTPFDLIVNKDATLLISRFVLGYDRSITVYGNITDAHSFDPTGKTPSLKFNSSSGVSVGGTATGDLTVENAYVELGNSSWKTSQATHTWNFKNSYVSATSFGNNNLPGSDAASWTVTFDDCVLTAKNYIKTGKNVTYNFTNNSVATTGSLRNDGVVYIDETSSVTTTSQQNNKLNAVDEHGGNNGTINVSGTLTIGSNSATQFEMLGGTLNVNGGTVALGNNTLTLDAASKLSSSGTINGSIIAADGATIEISGGTYTQDVSDWCVDGFLCEDNGDGTYGVVKEPWDGVTITNIDELKAFRDAVNSGVDYTGKTVVMTADIDLKNESWTPIGNSTYPFTGTFDGQGHTISNVNVNTTGDAGLFGWVAYQSENVTGTVQNLTVCNATIIAQGGYSAGVIGVARLGARITNVKLTGTVEIKGYRGVGGIVGNGFPTINNCTVEAEGTITATYWGAGGILGFASDRGAKASNSTITATGNGLTIHGELGGVGAVTGTPHGAATNGAKVTGVKITSNNDYYMSYVDASGTVSGDITVTDTTVTVSGSKIVGNDAVACIDDAVYFDFDKAVAAAAPGDTITLLDSITLEAALNIEKPITLNGNGKTITGSVKANADVTLRGVLNVAGTYYVYAGTTTIAEGADVDCTSTFGIWDGGNMVVSANAEFSASSLYFNGGAIDVYGKLIATSGNDGGLILNGADDTINIHEGGVLDVSYVDIYKTTGNSIVNVYGDANVSFKVNDGSGKFTWNIIGGSMNVAKHGIIMNSAESKINVNSGSLTATSIANNGTINVSGTSDIAAPVTGAGWVYMNGVTLDADTKLTGAKVRFASGTNNIDGAVITDGFFQVGIGAYNGIDANVDTENGVIVNVKNAKVGSNGDTYAGWIGTGFYDTDAEKEAAMTAAKYVLNIENSIAEFGYMHISNDGELNVNGNAAEKAYYNNSYYSFYSGDFIINGTATFDNADALALYTKVSCDNGTDKPGTLNIENGAHYEAERHNGAIDGTNFVLYKTGVVNVNDAELYIGEYTTIAADAVMNIGGSVTALGTITNNGTINLTAVDASLTTPEAPEVKSAIDNYDVSYADGSYTLTETAKPEILMNSLYVKYNNLGEWDFDDGNGKVPAIKFSLFAGVDTLKYNEVGFDVTVNGKENNFPITTVYDSVRVNMNGEKTVVEAEDFGYGVNHIFGQTLYFPATTDYTDTSIRWTPYAIRNGQKITEKTFELDDFFPGTLPTQLPTQEAE